MGHYYKKNSSYLRAAIFRSYKEKCAYCGRRIQQRDMHIDHIVPANRGEIADEEKKAYIAELEEQNFIVDSIENYLPSCGACNLDKSNRLFSVANLRYYHEKASAHVEEILRIIDELQEKEETYYEPVNAEIWEELRFSYQRDLSHAIMGYRLTPADVKACPRFPQVEKIKKQLEIVDYTVIEGETGCGKSISVFQVAFDFYKAGWRVYLCRVLSDEVVLSIPDNTELSLYVVDDAQLLNGQIIEKLKMQARPNAKIVFAKTVSSVVKQDTILLTNREAVSLIYNDFLKKKEEIVPIVRKYDRSIGTGFMDMPIERRLRAAKEAITPWQFNYILRGGWQTMKERYQTICRHNDCDLLATVIAVCQIMKLDHSVGFDWICEEINEIENLFNWTSSDLRYLVEKMIVISEDDVRIVHMESAKTVVALFIKDGDASKRKVLLRFIEKNFINKSFLPLGIVWLCNGLRSYSSIYNIYEFFISEKMIVATLENLQEYNTDEERMGIAWFMEMVFVLKYEKNGMHYFIRHKSHLLEWIQSANSKTAYAYSELINTVRNKDINKHREFVRAIDWIKLQKVMLSEKNPNTYVWGKLCNRLVCSLSKKEYLFIGKCLETVIEKFTNMASFENLERLTSFYCSVIHTNEGAVRQSIEKIIPLYGAYFKKDMCKAIEIFDFDFLRYMCGLNLLGGCHASKEQKKSAQQFVSVIPEKEFANTISDSLPRDWHSINPIMTVIGRYDSEKAKRIVNLIDRKSLDERARDSWRNAYEISELCEILYIGERKIAQKFIEDNTDKINVMYSFFIMVAPRIAIQVFESGVEVELVTEHWWGVSLFALKELLKIDNEKTKKILQQNIPKLVEKINSVTALDFNERYCLDFWLLISKCAPEILKTIIGLIDTQQVKNNWNRGTIYRGKEKQVENRRKQFWGIMMLSDESEILVSEDSKD